MAFADGVGIVKIGMNLLLWTAAAGEEHLPLLKDIKSWGFDGVELPMFAPDCSPWKTLAAEMDSLGLGRTAVAVLPEGASLIDEASSVRETGIAHLKACIDSCVEVGAETMCGPVYHPVGALVGRGPTDDERKRGVESLQTVGAYAKDAGIAIAVEPLNRFETYFLNCQGDAAELLDAVGNSSVGTLYDTFHANIEEKDIKEAIHAAGEHIVHVHISANDRATPGEDHVDWGTTFRELKAVDYDGWLTIEAFGAWLPEIAGATCIWRKMAPSEEHIAKEGCRHTREGWAKA